MTGPLQEKVHGGESSSSLEVFTTAFKWAPCPQSFAAVALLRGGILQGIERPFLRSELGGREWFIRLIVISE